MADSFGPTYRGGVDLLRVWHKDELILMGDPTALLADHENCPKVETIHD